MSNHDRGSRENPIDISAKRSEISMTRDGSRENPIDISYSRQESRCAKFFI